MSGITISVDLSKYNLDTKLKKFPKVMDDAMGKAARHIEGEAKERSPVVTSRYQTSWFVKKIKSFSRGLAHYLVGPNVEYSGWVEDGSSSPAAPKTHRGSDFKGYKVAKRTRDENVGAVRNIILRDIRRLLR